MLATNSRGKFQGDQLGGRVKFGTRFRKIRPSPTEQGTWSGAHTKEDRAHKQKKAGRQHPALRRPQSFASAFNEVNSLAIAFKGAHSQPHLLAQLPADEATYAVSLPTSSEHDRLQPGSGGSPEQGDHLGGLGVLAPARPCFAAGLFLALPFLAATVRLCAPPAGCRCRMAFQIRVTATCRLVNRSTGSTPGRLFQISTSRDPDHWPARAASSSRLLNVWVPSSLPWISFREAKTVMLFSASIVYVVMMSFSDRHRPREPAVDDIHCSAAGDKQAQSERGSEEKPGTVRHSAIAAPNAGPLRRPGQRYSHGPYERQGHAISATVRSL
jgi:hypothetical protein